VALCLYLFAPLRPEHQRPIQGILLGIAFVCLSGLADDKFQFGSAPQFAIQIIAAVIAIVATVWIQVVTLPIRGYTIFDWYITYPLTILWVMGMMNTVNFLDGLDGLAAGVGAIAALLFAIHSFNLEQPQVALYSLGLAGVCVGFLIFNFSPARVFLGSAGAMTLGFAMATLSILAPARVMTALLVMVIPITDTAFQIIDRWRRGKSPFQGDRGHLHFRLMDLGISPRLIVLGYWAFCAIGGTFMLLSSSIYKVITLAIMALIVTALLWRLRRRQTRQEL
jgi:UDP-GlcNAc:undecaprenyl-phosphate GlcNAc-1-phosphate transferase